jgi:hypothetical protein
VAFDYERKTDRFKGLKITPDGPGVLGKIVRRRND